MDLHISQEKSKIASFEPCSPGEETEEIQVRQVSQQVFAVFLTSAPTPRPLGPSNSTHYQPTEWVSLQMQCQKGITLSSTANCKTSDCLLRPKEVQNSGLGLYSVKHLIRRPPEYHVLVAPQRMGVFG